MKIRIPTSLKFVMGLLCAISFSTTWANVMKPDSLSVGSDTISTPVDSLAVFYYRASLDSLISHHLHPIDTTLTYFHQYKPIQQPNQLNTDLGSHGHAVYHQAFQSMTNPDFQMNSPAFTPYLIYGDRLKYFRLLRPYTELGYVSGPSKEQNLDVIFSRGLSQQIIFGLQLNIIHAPGAFQQQLAKHSNSYFTLQYQTKDKRYGINAQYFHNKLSVQENGGLAYDSIFEQHLETDKKVIPVRLSSAENRIYASGFQLEQYFRLMKSQIHAQGFNAGYLTYRFQYLKSAEVYEDADINADFYKNFPMVFDSLSTYDSTYQSRVSNRIQWSNQSGIPQTVSKPLHLYAGIRFDIVRQYLAYQQLEKSYQSSIPFGGIRLNFFKGSFIQSDFKYVIGGYHGGDFTLKSSLNQYLGTVKKNVGLLVIHLDIINRMPAWYFSYFHSNRFNWEQLLNKEHWLNLGVSYQIGHFEAGARLNTLQSYTFLDSSASVVQLNTTGTLFQLYTDGDLKLGNFGVNFHLLHQSSSMPQYIHVPAFSGKLNIYYKNWVFKKAAKLQTGFQLYYFTAFYSDAYMPELRLYYLQNEKKIGNYLFVDAYATLKVKRFRFFVKANNLLGYFGEAKYYDAPHYPSTEPGFFLGLVWRFHN